jgi:hypothetical protein
MSDTEVFVLVGVFLGFAMIGLLPIMNAIKPSANTLEACLYYEDKGWLKEHRELMNELDRKYGVKK